MDKRRKIEVIFSEEVFQRLEKYCRSKVIDRSMFVKMAVDEKLLTLEERAAFILAQKKLSKTTQAGSVPTTSATGMQVEIKTPASAVLLTKGEIPDKLSRNFQRYCEYVEGAEDAREHSMRLQICLDELKERAGDKPEQANAAFLKLQDLLKQRREVIPPKIETLPEGVPLDGDVDDDSP